MKEMKEIPRVKAIDYDSDNVSDFSDGEATKFPDAVVDGPFLATIMQVELGKFKDKFNAKFDKTV